ncbi:MAG: UvrD-helicase domain-containing protein [bacterium]
MKEIKNISLISAAGSGKTHALTKRFLFLYLHKKNFPLESLYAITFTNSAAYEMKSRIMRYLEVLARGSATNKQETDVLAYFTKIFSERELKEIASWKKDYLLHNLSDLNVSTFHSMFASFLSVIPFKAGILPDYKIIDELEEDLILQQSIDQYFENALKNQEFANTIMKLINSEKKDVNELILQLYRRLKPWLAQLSDLYKHREQHKNELEKCREDLVNVLDKFKDFVIKNIDATYTKAGKISNAWQSFLHKIDAFIKKGDDDSLYDILNYFAQENGMDKDYFRKFVASINNPQEYNKLIAAIRQKIFSYLKECSNDKLVIYFQPLIELHKIFEAEKKKKNVISFSDIEDYVLSVFKSDPEVDYLYFKLGAEINHLMIDEFQDTSYKQIDILEPILNEITAYQPEQKSLFYVGDPHQAIFRWRQGAPELFDELKKKYGKKIVSERLEMNYRTRKEIIDFVNKILDKEDKADPLNVGGWLRIEELGQFTKKDEGEEATMKKVVKIIKDLKKLGYKESDIAILTRTNSFAAELADVLSKSGVFCLSRARASIMDEPDIQLIIHLLKFMDNAEDDFSLLHILESEIAELNEDMIYTLVDIKNRENKSLYMVLLDHYASLPITKKLQELLSFVYFMNPYQLVFHIYKSFGLKMSYPIATLLDATIDYIAEGYGSLSDFINWLEYNGPAIEVKETQFEGVRIMTIHKAKGLEFEIVILPETNFELKNKDKIMFSYKENARPDQIYWRDYGKYLPGLVEKEEALEKIDNLNLLYVALTRAKSGVYMLGFRTEKKNLGFWFEYIKEKLNGEPLPCDNIPEKRAEPGEKKTSTIRDEKVFVKIPQVREEREIYSPTERGLEIIEFARRHGMRFGEIVHKVLSKIEWLDGLQIDQVVEDLLKFAKDNCVRTLRDLEDVEKKLKSLLYETFTDPDLRVIFYKEGRSADFRNEIALYFEDENKDVSVHIDRLIFEPQKVLVVDYKTGSEKKDDRHQIEMYKQGIRLMYPDIEIQSILLYLENNRGNKLKFIE